MITSQDAQGLAQARLAMWPTVSRRTWLGMFTFGALMPQLAWPVATLDATANNAANEIMKKNFYASKLQSVETDSTMLLVTDSGQMRERKMKTLQRLKANGIDTKLVMKFDAPADIRGVGFLQIENSDADDDQWIYLPALKKSRRLVANNKKDSFMGSDFSYGDFSRPKVETYQHKLLKSELCDGHDCFLIESVPSDNTVRDDRGYSRKLTWVRKDSFLEARTDYFDLGGELLKTQIALDHKLLEPETGRWFAMHREIVNHQTQHKTVLHVTRAQAGVPAPEQVFTSRNIEQG